MPATPNINAAKITGDLTSIGAFTVSGNSSFQGITATTLSATTLNAHVLSAATLTATTLFVKSGDTQFVGSSETFFIRRFGTAISFNRDPNLGTMSTAGAHGYQLNHIQSTTATADTLAWQVYTPAGGSLGPSIGINGAGNVGINTITPLYKWHLRNASAGNVSIIGGTVGAIENNTTNYLTFLQPDANVGGITWGSPSDAFGAYVRWGFTQNQLDISTSTAGGILNLMAGSDVPVMTMTSTQINLLTNNIQRGVLNSTGKFGLGTTSPTEQLHITGNTLIGGGLTGTSATISGNTRVADGILFVSRLQDVNLSMISANVGTANVNAFQLNIDQPNSKSNLDARNGYSLGFQISDAEKALLTSNNFQVLVPISAGTISANTISTNSFTANTIFVKGTGSTNATTAFTISNSSGLISLIALDNGNVYANGGGTGNTSNTAFGLNTMVNLTTGVQNNGFGRSLQNVSSGNNNNGVGYLALGNNTSGSGNIGIGTGALRFNQTSSNSIAIGTDALSVASGGTNIGIGTNTLANLTTGANNTSVGYNTGLGITTGDANTIFGANVSSLPSGLTNTVILSIGTGSKRLWVDNVSNLAFGSSAMAGTTLGVGGNNIAIGGSALQTTTSATDTMAIGTNALKNLTTGTNNTALGNRALENVTLGGSNVAVGRNAMLSATGSSSHNVAIGANALLVTSGDSSVAIGSSALQSASGGTNTAVGFGTLSNLTTGIGNTVVGYSSNGSGLISANYNTILGGNITGLDSGLTQNIIISDGLGNQRIRSDNAGNIFVYGLSGATSITATTGFVKSGYGSLISQSSVGDFLTSQFISNGGLFISSRQSQPMGFHINAVEKMRLTSAGLFGIGTNAPRELLEVSGNTVTSGLTAITQTIRTAQFVSGYTYSYVTSGTSNSAQTIDWNITNNFDYNLSANTTFTFSNNKNGQTLIMTVSNNSATTGLTSTFSAITGTIKWQGGTTPTQTPATGKTDIYTFIQSNAIIYGVVSPNF